MVFLGNKIPDILFKVIITEKCFRYRVCSITESIHKF